MKDAHTLESPRRREAIAAAAVAGLLGAFAGRAFGAVPAYPTRAVTMISPFAPGGPNDIVARSVAESLKDVLKQPVLVENLSGAGGIIGAKRVLAAAPDGYTLLAGAAYLVTAPYLYKSADFEVARDFVPLSPPVESLLVFVSGKGGDLKALLQKAKQTGVPVRVAAPGMGTLSHLGSEMLRLASGAPMVQAQYRGVAPALNDIMGGHADLLLDGISSSLPLIREGRLTALAVPDDARNPLLPAVPTTAELGFSQVKVRAWNAIFASAATPPAIVEQLATEITRIVARPEFARELSKRGLEPTPITPAAFRERLVAESAHWKSVVSAARITVE